MVVATESVFWSLRGQTFDLFHRGDIDYMCFIADEVEDPYGIEHIRICYLELLKLKVTFRASKIGVKQKVREKSRECQNYKPQPCPDTERKRKPTNPNKLKSNKRTKALRLALSSPSEVIAMLKGLTNTRTKWHKVRHKTNRLVE